VLDRIEFIQGDLLEPLKNREIDLIVSNPPYVPTQELDQSPVKETRGLQFEPRIALDGGSDGLKFVNKIKEFGVPAVLETIGGEIITVNF
jgi:release factor glutamine methyltransferase